MADLPDWLLALLGGQQNNLNAQGPSPSGGLLAGAMPPPMGGLLTAPRPVPVYAGVDPAADPNTPIRSTAGPMDMSQGRSVATGGTDVPDTAPTSGTNVIGTPASGTTEASSPGFLSKAGSVLGSLYGQGGPGDALISLGAGIASPEGWATGVQKSLAAQSGSALNNARLQAFKLQQSQLQDQQNSTYSYFRSKGLTPDVAKAATLNPDLASKYISQFAGGNKSIMVTDPKDNSVYALNPYDPTDKTQVFAGAEEKPFVIGKDPNTGTELYGIRKEGKIVSFDPNAQGSGGQDNTYKTVDAVASGLPPVDTSKTPAPGSPEAAAVRQRGEAFLSNLEAANPALKNSGFAAQVRAVAEGREPYPVGTRSPAALALMRAVNQYDPFFDVTNSNARKETRSDFAHGEAAKTITKGNTVIGHVGHMSDWAEQLAQSNTSIPLFNQIKNQSAINMGRGLPALNYDTWADLVSKEATSFYSPGGGTEAEREAIKEKLKSAASPDQLKSTLKTITDAIDSKVSALQDRWHQGMGPLSSDYPILTPSSQATLAKVKERVANVPGGTTDSGSPPPVAPPPPPKFGDVINGHRFIGGPQANPADPNSWQPIGAQM